MVKKALIIGSGVTGLTVARHLSQAGMQIEIIDKGYKLGGRLATRAKQGYQFDHGTPALETADGFEDAVASEVLVRSDHHAWFGQPEMRSLCGYLAQGFSVTQGCEIEAVEMCNHQLVVRLKDCGETDLFDAVVCTAPAPQAAQLLAAFEELAELARQADYAPQWTCMLGFDTGFEGLSEQVMMTTDHPVLARLLFEHKKPGRPSLPAVTLHATTPWSFDHLEQSPEQALAAMSAACSEILGLSLPTPAYAAAHRWRYARCIQTAGAVKGAIASQAAVAVAGDWVSKPDIAGGLASAQVAANLILQRLEL